ncbi:MAG: manganese efflux pump [Clostridium sp.]|nr:manganese efflux pump [Clostridium sp.]
MNLKDIIIVGIALAMDAVGVTVSIGVNPKVIRRNKIAFIMSFAIFQFLFFLLGGIGGHLFEKYITTIPNIVGGVAIAIVGILMIKEGFEDNETLLLKREMVIILGISVSIDAFVVGFTGFNYISSALKMIGDCSIVGLITLILCSFTFYLCRYIRKIGFIAKYASFFGGITLIIFAIKMIFF